MQVQNSEDILIFHCQQCFEFPQYPKQCSVCNRIYCRSCNIGLRKSKCKCLNFSDLDPILSHIYNQIIIQCQLCNQIFKLTQISKHSIKCQYQFSQGNRVSIQKCQYCLFESIVGQKIELNNCQFCLRPFVNFKNDDRQIILREEQIDQELNQLIKRCEFCQIEGPQIELINHEKICQQALAPCDCGLQFKRIKFMNHFKLCLDTLVQNEKQNLIREEIILHLNYIYVAQKILNQQKATRIYCQQLGFIQIREDFYNDDTKKDRI